MSELSGKLTGTATLNATIHGASSSGTLSAKAGMTATLTPAAGSLYGRLSGTGVIFAALSTYNMPVGHETYGGVYEVIPSTEKQVLPTAQTVMEDDVTIQEIPYYETTNESGGYTVIIG